MTTTGIRKTRSEVTLLTSNQGLLPTPHLPSVSRYIRHRQAQAGLTGQLSGWGGKVDISWEFTQNSCALTEHVLWGHITGTQEAQSGHFSALQQPKADTSNLQSHHQSLKNRMKINFPQRRWFPWRSRIPSVSLHKWVRKGTAASNFFIGTSVFSHNAIKQTQ